MWFLSNTFVARHQLLTRQNKRSSNLLLFLLPDRPVCDTEEDGQQLEEKYGVVRGGNVSVTCKVEANPPVNRYVNGQLNFRLKKIVN